MIVAKTGFIADFKIGYLQLALALQRCAVVGGTDESFDGEVTGYAVGRLVKITNNEDGLPVIGQPSNVTAASIGNATHIIAQSDNTLRNFPGDAIDVEKYTQRYQGILGNTFTATDTVLAPVTTNLEHWKTVSVYKITNADDIKIIPIKPSTVSVVR